MGVRTGLCSRVVCCVRVLVRGWMGIEIEFLFFYYVSCCGVDGVGVGWKEGLFRFGVGKGDDIVVFIYIYLRVCTYVFKRVYRFVFIFDLV